MRTEKISEFTTQRLSTYLRCLESLDESGVETTSSIMLAKQFDLNSAQIRKDLACFGQFGVRGVGYVVRDLKRHIVEILGINVVHKVGIIGGGNLGMALAEYAGFRKNGFLVVAILDSAAAKIGLASRSGVPILGMNALDEVIRSKGITMAIIAVPAEAGQSVCDLLVAAGIRAILNFAPVRLASRPGTKIMSIDLSVSLESLSYFLSGQHSNPLQSGENFPAASLASD